MVHTFSRCVESLNFKTSSHLVLMILHNIIKLNRSNIQQFEIQMNKQHSMSDILIGITDQQY